MPTLKPAYGTPIESNAITADLRACYVLNGSSLTALVNSVNGVEPLIGSGSGMTFDATGVGSIAFAGAGSLALPSSVSSAITAATSATIMIRYSVASGTNGAVFDMGGGAGDVVPNSGGQVYCSALATGNEEGVFGFAFNINGDNPTNLNTITVVSFGTLGTVSGGFANAWDMLINGAGVYGGNPSTIDIGTGVIGANAAAAFLTGNIEFLYIWTRALTTTEITTLHLDPYTPIFGTPAPPPTQRGNIAYDQIKASDRTGDGNQLLTYSEIPATSGAAGTAGQIAVDGFGNWFWCYAANSWARIGPAGYSISW
jgi:hypothetical protein